MTVYMVERELPAVTMDQTSRPEGRHRKGAAVHCRRQERALHPHHFRSRRRRIALPE